jgi:hypothetical protein
MTRRHPTFMVSNMDDKNRRSAKSPRPQIYRDLRERNERRAQMVAQVLESRRGRRIERAMQVARERRFTPGP